jgi:hypothetical protein
MDNSCSKHMVNTCSKHNRTLTLENMQEKQDAEVKARRLQDEVDEQRKARTLAETHARTLSTTLEQEEEALRGAQESGGNLAARYADLTLCIYVCVYIHICMYVGGCICPRRRSRPKAGHAKGDSKGATPRVLAHAPLGFSRRFCSAKICPTRGSDRGGRARTHTHTHCFTYLSIYQ